VTIDRLGFLGDGLATTEEGEWRVPLALPGERWRVRPEAREGRRRRASALERLGDASADRIEPPCPHFGRCGGCSLQHLTPPAYHALKRRRIEGALRAHGLEAPPLEPTVTSPPGSRRRVRLHRDAAGRPGFRARAGRAIVAIGQCPVAAAPIEALLAPLRGLLPRLSTGGPMQVSVTLFDQGLDLLLHAAGPPSAADTAVLGAFAEEADIARIAWRQDDGPSMVMAERRPPMLTAGTISLAVPPSVFLQATGEGLEALQAFAEAELRDTRRVIDLFAGMAPLSLPLLPRLERLRAVDADADALRAVRHLAGAIETERRDLATEPVAPRDLGTFDAAIVDPPRAGAPAQIEALAASRIGRIVYAACDPASFARDAAVLTRAGFRIERLQPIDQFLWSPEIELAASFRRG